MKKIILILSLSFCRAFMPIDLGKGWTTFALEDTPEESSVAILFPRGRPPLGEKYIKDVKDLVKIEKNGKRPELHLALITRHIDPFVTNYIFASNSTSNTSFLAQVKFAINSQNLSIPLHNCQGFRNDIEGLLEIACKADEIKMAIKPIRISPNLEKKIIVTIRDYLQFLNTYLLHICYFSSDVNSLTDQIPNFIAGLRQEIITQLQNAELDQWPQIIRRLCLENAKFKTEELVFNIFIPKFLKKESVEGYTTINVINIIITPRDCNFISPGESISIYDDNTYPDLEQKRSNSTSILKPKLEEE